MIHDDQCITQSLLSSDKRQLSRPSQDGGMSHSTHVVLTGLTLSLEQLASQ